MRPSLAPRAELVQLRRGYKALWNDLVLTVESGKDGWMASVGDRASGKRLYRAQRLNALCAKAAAAEFAMFQAPGAAGLQYPEAPSLKCEEYW